MLKIVSKFPRLKRVEKTLKEVFGLYFAAPFIVSFFVGDIPPDFPPHFKGHEAVLEGLKSRLFHTFKKMRPSKPHLVNTF